MPRYITVSDARAVCKDGGSRRSDRPGYGRWWASYLFPTLIIFLERNRSMQKLGLMRSQDDDEMPERKFTRTRTHTMIVGTTEETASPAERSIGYGCGLVVS